MNHSAVIEHPLHAVERQAAGRHAFPCMLGQFADDALIVDVAGDAVHGLYTSLIGLP